MDKQPDKIQYHYNMSNLYRVIHADGAYGGLTPYGYINMNFFAERNTIPESSIHPIEDGRLGEEILELRTGKKGIIREVETGIVMDVERAKVLVKWLRDKIDEFEGAMKTAKENNDGSTSNK